MTPMAQRSGLKIGAHVPTAQRLAGLGFIDNRTSNHVVSRGQGTAHESLGMSVFESGGVTRSAHACVLACAVLFAVASVQQLARAVPPRATRGGEWYYDLYEVPRATETWLASPLSLRVDDWTLDTLADYLRQQGVATRIDRPALEAVGIPADAKLNGAIQSTSAEAGLESLLEELGATIVIDRGGMLTITTTDIADEKLCVRVYNLTGIVRGKEPRHWDFDSVIDLTTSTVAPETWDEVGGPGGIEPYSAGQPLLVVAQTRQVQDQVTRLLATLRRHNGSASDVLRSSPSRGDSRLGPVRSRLQRTPLR